MLNRWREAADDNGYILAAPQWETGNAGYTFSDREHLSVLDTLRDLRRRYRVDSDRVFLFGLRDGGVMAFDVGMSHPDLFAGVSTMGAVPDKFGEVYWRNAQNLPYYVVNGDRVGPLLDKTHKHFEHWVDRHFASLWVQYKGRGAEWFGGEVPLIFEWMRIKRRAFPLTQLGKDGGGTQFGTEFNSMRPTDNSFYWLTTDDVMPACCKTAQSSWAAVNPARLQALIYPESNDIRVKAYGVKQVSVWLGRNLRGESMIDFTKPVSFRVNDTQVLKKVQVKPSLAVMLEDLYRRGDRQRVYMAKLDWPTR
jgi:pimeloyl-ACP methyl ester carboxylesterase